MPQWQALAISIGIESLTVALMLARMPNYKRRTMIIGALVIASATLLTHPIAWMLNRDVLWRLQFPLRASIIETLVVFAEAIIIASIIPASRLRCLALAACANMMSFLYGLILLRT